MHKGFVNLNSGTPGEAIIEGRVNPGVLIGKNSDVGAGTSIMGTLWGANTGTYSDSLLKPLGEIRNLSLRTQLYGHFSSFLTCATFTDTMTPPVVSSWRHISQSRDISSAPLIKSASWVREKPHPITYRLNRSRAAAI